MSGKTRGVGREIHDDHLQLRAKQCRAIAATSRDADQRVQMLEVARDYERLAERLTAMNGTFD